MCRVHVGWDCFVSFNLFHDIVKHVAVGFDEGVAVWFADVSVVVVILAEEFGDIEAVLFDGFGRETFGRDTVAGAEVYSIHGDDEIECSVREDGR